MAVFSTDLESMGYTYLGQPFIEVDATDGLTSPGYMGVTYNGEPVTFVPNGLLAPPSMAFPSSAKIFSRGIIVGAMGFKLPHFP
jgi:hypothetical protein